MRIEYSPFCGLVLTFDPSKEDTEFAIRVLQSLVDSSRDEVNQAVARYFLEQLQYNNSSIN